MCTSISMYEGIYGRNLDLDHSFGQEVIITPRRYPFTFQQGEPLQEHPAMIGTATNFQGYPLYAEAMNEYGLYMAGLNFPGNADYSSHINLAAPAYAPYELIPWILGTCKTVQQAKQQLADFQILNKPIVPQIPLAPLHWQIADEKATIVLEIMQDGIHIYDDPVGVLTNNPPFPFHQYNLRQYRHLSANADHVGFPAQQDLETFGEGMGAIGLPGDFSPASRYVKAAFLKWTAAPAAEEEQQIQQFFHILDGVAMIKGSVITKEGNYDITIYSCALSKKTKTYYYKTYDCSQIHMIRMEDVDLNASRLFTHPMQENVNFQLEKAIE